MTDWILYWMTFNLVELSTDWLLINHSLLDDFKPIWTVYWITLTKLDDF